MNFVSNFCEMALMCNNDIIIKTDADTFVLHMPTIKSEYDNVYNYNLFLGFCCKPLEELQKEFNVGADFSRMKIIKEIIDKNVNIGIDLLHNFAIVIQDFEYVDDSFKCGCATITDEVFDLICMYVSIASAAQTMEDYENLKKEETMSPEEREWERKRRINEEKIRRNKSKNKEKTELQLIVAAVSYEFNISLKDVLDMNKYSVYFLYDCAVSRIASYEINQIAAATGNLPKKTKHKYFTN